MFVYLLLTLLSLVLSLIFPNLLFIIVLISAITFISLKLKKKRYLFLIIIIAYGYIFSAKPYEIPYDSFRQKLIVHEQNQNYSLLADQNSRMFITYEDFGPKGSSIIADTSYSPLRRINFPGMSEFADFMNNRGVYYEVKVLEVYSSNTSFSLRETAINYLIRDNPISKPFLKLILFSDKSESEDFYNKLKDLSILHLFVISGFHINILFNFLKQSFKRFIKNELFILFLTIPYLYLLDFSIPSVKAFIFILLNIVNMKYLGNKFDRLINLTIVALLILLVNPTSVKSYSFILSMLASLNIELISKIKIKNNVSKYLLFNILIFLGILPIILIINYEFNLLAILYNLVMSFVIPPIYIVSIISVVFYPLQTLMTPLIEGFNLFTDKIYEYSIMLIMGKPSEVFVLLYYFNYYLMLVSLEVNNYINYSKLAFTQILFLFFQYYRPFLLPTSSVSFLNVNQGDSTLIIREHAKEVILIDTGGSRFFEVSKSRTIPYLKFLGIKHIDYVITTHDDFDHVGSLPYLIENYNVKQVIDGQTIEKKGILTNLNFGYEAIDDNNRSAVFYFTMNNTSFLLTADIDSTVEKKIIDDYDFSADVLKVSHHGSRFGTSKALLDKVKPSIAIVSAGLNNIYNHPHPSVLNRLEISNVNLFRTDKDGTIVFLFNQFSLINSILGSLKYAIIVTGDLYGLFSPWLPKTIS